VVLARLSEKLGVAWEGFPEQPSVDQLAAAAVGRERDLTVAQEGRLVKEVLRVEREAAIEANGSSADEDWQLVTSDGGTGQSRRSASASKDHPETFAIRKVAYRAEADVLGWVGSQPRLDLEEGDAAGFSGP